MTKALERRPPPSRLFCLVLAAAGVVAGAWLLERLALVAGILGLVLGDNEFVRWLPRQRLLAVPVLAAAFLASLFVLLLRGLRGKHRWRLAVVGLSIAIASVVLMRRVSSQPIYLNRLGLAADPPEAELQATQGLEEKAAEYPRFGYRTNSLGYRSREPLADGPGVLTVWTVGNSFTWGDGVAGEEDLFHERLAHHLRATGAKLPVHAYSAAFLGETVFGYTETIDRISAAYGADWFVIGFVGCPAMVPLDRTSLLDAIPPGSAAWTFLIASGTFKHVSEAAWRSAVWDCTPESLAYAREKLDRIDRLGRERGFRVAVFEYFEAPGLDFPEGWTVVSLPPGLKPVAGTANQYWYRIHPHPKAPLVDVAARLVGEAMGGG